MYYISSVNYELDKKYGVTDTIDGVEEFYTQHELIDMYRNHNIRINGMTYTGSSFKFDIRTLDIIFLENLDRGSSFIMICDDIERQYLYVGQNGKRDFVYFDGKKQYILTREFLKKCRYKNSNKVLLSLEGINSNKDKELKESFKKYYPTNQLSLFI